ncbi:polysaccharide deacetylase family protein [Corallococcus macrosporus]|uniref:Polysaccharide deacetylase n=1 Tax=Corallococcus macrosporus DSM 14697 TaxID=1189310 RepID=A0A250JPV5_9BACT|nr:polysaccharide deacetylase family protein [Corallococcus macrosporus]ATB45899.1 polysaccharide deacetylase [Corallococcus macrosporus DSM 14697]
MSRPHGMYRRLITLLFLSLAAPAFAAKPFTEGMVTITLDDGWATQYSLARPELNARNLPATYGLVTLAIHESWAGYINLTQAQTLVTEGNDIASHTLTHPDLTSLSPAQLLAELQDSRTWLENALGLPAVPNLIVPYGLQNGPVLDAIRQHYASSRTVNAGRNFRDTVVYELRANDVARTVPVSTVQGWVDQAIAEKSWLILVFHEFTNGTPTRDTEYLTSQFADILDYVQTQGVRTVTLAEGLALTEGRTEPDLTAGLFVYNDALQNGFADWSWADHSLDETGVVHTGSASIRFEPDTWNGLLFHHHGLDLADHQSLRVWVHGGTVGGQAVRLVLHDGAQLLGTIRLDTALGGPIAPGVWQQVSIPLASIGATTGTLRDIYFQDDSGTDQPVMYLDDLVLLPH